MVYGGRKNCSSTTYMPRSISVRRKYLPALSREDSLPSSQRSFRGSRKPWGGGPAGVAARRDVLAKVADGIFLCEARKTVRGIEVGSARASAVRERAEAMVRCKEDDTVAKCELRAVINKEAVIGWNQNMTLIVASVT